MKKLNIDEWLTETVMAMYELSNSAVRVKNIVGSKFSVKVGVHQGSVLSPLLLLWSSRHYPGSLEVVYHGSCSMQMTL